MYMSLCMFLVRKRDMRDFGDIPCAARAEDRDSTVTVSRET